jgi:hypothetical protein
MSASLALRVGVVEGQKPEAPARPACVRQTGGRAIAVAIGANCADFVEEFENTPCRGISGFAAFLMNVRKKDALKALV